MTVPVRWRKASSGTQTCVEVAHTLTAVRDSKNPGGPTLVAEVGPLLAAVKGGLIGR